jgi:hypothetical protein
MSQTRRIAFVTFLALVGAVLAGQPAATPDVVETPTPIETVALDGDTLDEPSLTLVESDWCYSACVEECGEGECATFFTSGCNCHWLCESGMDGTSYCMGAIGISICAN